MRELIQSLFPALLKEHRTQIVSLMMQLSPNSGERQIEQNYEKMWRYLEDGSAIVFVAAIGGDIIGYIWGYFRQNEGEDRVHVTQFVVDRAYRGRGIGKRLLEKMNAYAGENNCDAVELNVLPYNVGAIQFYLHNGYEPQRIFMRRTIGQADMLIKPDNIR